MLVHIAQSVEKKKQFVFKWHKYSPYHYLPIRVNLNSLMDKVVGKPVSDPKPATAMEGNGGRTGEELPSYKNCNVIIES